MLKAFEFLTRSLRRKEAGKTAENIGVRSATALTPDSLRRAQCVGFRVSLSCHSGPSTGGSMFYEPAAKLFCHHRLAGEGKLAGPLIVDTDSIAAHARIRQIEQFNLEPLAGLMITEQERIMGIGV